MSLDAARDVSLRHMRRFVREHARQLGFIVSGQNKTVVDANETSGGANALIESSRTTKNWKRWPESPLACEAIREPSDCTYSVTSGPR
ncbi:MAG: hypothetical protein IPG25_13890 [Proteobacteria bacterium]|nr:hypothetical protein [Pseudomonadota bacterium]